MRKKHEPNEYYKYRNTIDDNNSCRNYKGPNGACKIVIFVFIFFLISFIIDGASSDAIDTLLAFGIVAYLFAKWVFDQII